MEHFDEQLAQRVDVYIESLFIAHDPVLQANLADADAAGLPAIQVSPNQGKLLYLFAKMIGARRILEVGTLGGYSTTWLARALPPQGGELVTLELSPAHAAVASHNLSRAGLSDVVHILTGDAADSMRSLVGRGETPFDLIFIDGDKPAYVAYLHLAMQLSHSGTLILADNVIRNGRVLDPAGDDAKAGGVRHYLETIAADERLESLALPLLRDKLDGLAISRVK